MFTLNDFLNLPLMEEADLLTSKLDVSQKPVQYISVQEPPVEGFIRENEIILSTAIALDNQEALFKFVQNVCHFNAAALIFSFVPDSNLTINQAIIDFAYEHQFPIIEIPWDLRFSDVTEAVITELKRIESKDESSCAELQKEILQLYFVKKSLDDVARLIAEKTRHSVKIMDRNRNEKGACLLQRTDYFHEMDIEVNDNVYGYLYLSVEPAMETEPVNVELLNHYINVPLSLWFEKEEVINITGLKIRNDYVWKLAIEKNNTQEIINQGVQLGFDMNTLYFCALLKLDPKDTELHSYDPEMITKTEKNMLALLKEKDIRSLLSYKNERFILFLENKPDSNVSELLDDLEKSILESITVKDFHWGIAEKPIETTNFPEQYRKAKVALEQAIDLNISRLNFKQSRITSLVNQMTPHKKAREQAIELLNPILTNNRLNENGMDLIETIVVYIKSNFNTSKTSRELMLHRQSLLYRLEKFEELTQLSLTNADDLFLLQYYLRLLNKFD
ncbi:purine catabolism transcriptional regulator PucR [Alkalibacterium psychrotolerans]